MFDLHSTDRQRFFPEENSRPNAELNQAVREAMAPVQLPRVSWFDYYLALKEQKGDPVEYQNSWLLFSDGTKYGRARDFSGPEVAPPKDDPRALWGLMRTYWKTRKELVAKELRELQPHIARYKELQQYRSAPLQTLMSRFDEETKRWVQEPADLDIPALEERASWLKEDIENCDQHIKALGNQEEVQHVFPGH